MNMPRLSSVIVAVVALGIGLSFIAKAQETPTPAAPAAEAIPEATADADVEAAETLPDADATADAEPAIDAEPAVDTANAAPEGPHICFDPFDPVLTLGFGSRYTATSKSRSDFDAKSDAAVTAALKPIDKFITKLALEANLALTLQGEDATLAANCVLDRIAEWASADALGTMETQGAKLSVPSRIGGIATAYAIAKPLVVQTATPDARVAAIEPWLAKRAAESMAFFDTEAPPKASRNNLRAWAALAVARVGLILQDEPMIAWADASVRLVACEANSDGSLPNEMWRGKLALHYQIHAVGPLVVTAALLEDRGADLFNACDRAIPRAVSFVVAALEDPELVVVHAGAPQTATKAKLRAFELAWATAYLKYIDDPAVAALAGTFTPLSNSKYGGDQSLLW
ncbi:MAG: alginate lyase family protein [Paracoccaceae bacterium]